MADEPRDMLEAIQRYHPLPWNLIPDLGLYMDQVITLITRVYEPLYGEDIHSYLSSSMINNYVKSKLIPRPTGKKYNRDQIALLTMIVALKQVSSMEDIRRMLALKADETVESLYGAFCERFGRVIHALGTDESLSFGELKTPLDFAIMASGFSARCSAALKAEKTEGQ